MDECNAILDKIASKLHEGSTKARTILNTLSLIEFLLKNGSPRFKMEIEEDQFFIKKMKNFYDDNDEEDLSKSIQILVQRIITFLENTDELKSAKEEAKMLRNRIMGFGNEATSSSNGMSSDVDSKYSGISSDNYNTDKNGRRNESNLAQKLGLEPKSKVRTHSPEKVERVENKDFDHNSKNNIDNVDFLGSSNNKTQNNNNGSNNFNILESDVDFGNKTGNVKTKPMSKLLPPPPKKNQNKFESGVNKNEGNNTKINEGSKDVGSLLDQDFSQLKIEPGFQQQKKKDSADFLFDGHVVSKNEGESKKVDDFTFDFMQNGQSQPIIVSDKKQSIDFLDLQPKIVSGQNNSNKPLNDVDMFDFSQDSFTNKLDVNVESKTKAVSKLPMPPKKGEKSLKNDGDFLF